MRAASERARPALPISGLTTVGSRRWHRSRLEPYYRPCRPVTVMLVHPAGQ
jgi:hypothetical protein